MINSGLKQRFLRAAGWTLLGHALSLLLRLGSSLVLTRLLAPELYGVMAVGYVVMTGLHMFSDIGLISGAIRSERGDDPAFLNVGWIVQIARGLVVTLGGFAAAAALKLAADAALFPLQSVYADPKVPLLVAVISISGVISGFESTKVWWARRHLALAALTKIDVGCQFASTFFIVGWALLSPTIWALAAGAIFTAVVRTALTHALLPGPTNRFEWNASAFSEIIHFGKWVILSSTFTFLLLNGDRLLLGAMLDSKTMGLYTTALVLISAVQGAVVGVVGNTVLPALSEVFRNKPADLRSAVYKIRMPLDWVCLLAAGTLVFLGEPIIELLYDPRYTPSGWMLSVLALTLVAIRIDVFDQCLLAIGRVKLLSQLNGIRLVTLYCVIPAGYILHGVNGAVIGVAVSAMINAFLALTLQHRVGLLNPLRELIAIPIFSGGMLIGWAAQNIIHLMV